VFGSNHSHVDSLGQGTATETWKHQIHLIEYILKTFNDLMNSKCSFRIRYITFKSHILQYFQIYNKSSIVILLKEEGKYIIRTLCCFHSLKCH
jgi:hypothetical protein